VDEDPCPRRCAAVIRFATAGAAVGLLLGGFAALAAGLYRGALPSGDSADFMPLVGMSVVAFGVLLAFGWRERS
jgi:hypothetical protein